MAVNASGVRLNVLAGDQYVANARAACMFAPQVLSRAVEDSGTVTPVLVPWDTCGAYNSGVLGVSPASYFPSTVPSARAESDRLMQMPETPTAPTVPA